MVATRIAQRRAKVYLGAEQGDDVVEGRKDNRGQQGPLNVRPCKLDGADAHRLDTIWARCVTNANQNTDKTTTYCEDRFRASPLYASKDRGPASLCTIYLTWCS